MKILSRNYQTSFTQKADTPKARWRQLSPRLIIIAAGVIALIIVVVGVAYLISKNRSLKAELSALQTNPEERLRKEAEAVVARVGELMVLPEGELPSVFTINDTKRFVGQPFFAKAKQGDKVLIYTNAKKVILYDPVAHKILEVAPLNIGNSGTTP